MRGRGKEGRLRKLAHRSALSLIQSSNFNPILSARRFGPPAHNQLLAQSAPATLVDLNLLRHELRTPLTGMLGLAEMLAALDLPAKATFWLATLQACGQQMASLIDRALRMEEAGFVAGQQPAVNGLQFIETLITAHWPAARAGGTRLMLAFDAAALGLWQADPVLLRQALDNLLANAIRFSRNGHVLLEVRMVAQDSVGFNQLELLIEDSGPSPVSIPSNLQDEGEFADRAYRMFSRGRGLQVTEQACQQFAGHLRRCSGNSGGARFTLTLNGLFPAHRQPVQPFRPALLRKLHCVLRLEKSQQAALAAMLRCLDISFEFSSQEGMQELDTLPPLHVLICATTLLPYSIQRCVGDSAAHSIWLLASYTGIKGPDFYQQLLPELLLQTDLQNALLRCLVEQGMATCQQRQFEQ